MVCGSDHDEMVISRNLLGGNMRVAIMQPYFFPYAGYYRLFAAVDLFVVYDCVQFPRRGWVHRNRLSDFNGADQWLTLPLQKGDRDRTRICDLVFAKNARNVMEEQMRRFPCFIALAKKEPELAVMLSDFSVTPVQYLLRSLEWSVNRLGLNCSMVRSSSLNIAEIVKGQDRIIEIVKRIGGKTYINAPGGVSLYDSSVFEEAGMTLKFLPDYVGSYKSVLERMLTENVADLAQEIRKNTL